LPWVQPPNWATEANGLSSFAFIAVRCDVIFKWA